MTRVAIRDQQRLATIYADTPTAAWILPGPRWWPRPRRVEPSEANAQWTTRRCTACWRYRAQLTALADLPEATELCVTTNPSPNWEDATWPYEITFDGGARSLDETEVAGAGAILWEHDTQGGCPRQIASTVIAIPWKAGAQAAEAAGCCAGLRLLQTLRPAHRAARVVGDNLGVIRYGAGTARLRRLQMQAQLEAALATTLSQGWRLSWQAVRRRLNHAADALATEGVLWARDLVTQGHTAIATRTTWTAYTDSNRS